MRSGHILDPFQKPTGLADGLEVRCERKGEVKDDLKVFGWCTWLFTPVKGLWEKLIWGWHPQEKRTHELFCRHKASPEHGGILTELHTVAGYKREGTQFSRAEALWGEMTLPPQAAGCSPSSAGQQEGTSEGIRQEPKNQVGFENLGFLHDSYVVI